MGFGALVAVTVLAALGVWVLRAMETRDSYLSSGLAPHGSPFPIKDLAAYCMTSLPRLGRLVRQGTTKFDLRGDEKRWGELEGAHTGFVFADAALQGPPSSNSNKQPITQNKYFAENYYFWLSDAAQPSTGGQFLVTTRLSFYGTNASRVIPWFTFQLDGVEYNLPAQFDPHKHQLGSKELQAVDVHGLGKLEFVNVRPMREWRLRYDGQMESQQQRVHVKAEFTLLFSELDVFSYQLHWDEMATALALAGKPWTQSFFRNLRAQNQERYASRSHSASGYVQIEGEEEEKRREFAALHGSRDHLWGIRNWVFMPRYIWWPPITLKHALVIDQVAYTSFIGAFVEYGNTMSNMVVGGLMSDAGEVASFSGATHMRDIAPEWYAEPPTTAGEFIGERLVPGNLKLEIGLLGGEYVMEVAVERGRKHGLWSHTFSLAEGRFEIHEALARFQFVVRKRGGGGGGGAAAAAVVSNSTATGLFEFGATVVPVASYDDESL